MPVEIPEPQVMTPMRQIAENVRALQQTVALPSDSDGIISKTDRLEAFIMQAHEAMTALESHTATLRRLLPGTTMLKGNMPPSDRVGSPLEHTLDQQIESVVDLVTRLNTLRECIVL